MSAYDLLGYNGADYTVVTGERTEEPVDRRALIERAVRGVLPEVVEPAEGAELIAEEVKE